MFCGFVSLLEGETFEGEKKGKLSGCDMYNETRAHLLVVVYERDLTDKCM